MELEGDMITYTAGYKYDPEGVHARVLDFPGAISCGTDLADARSMLADALWIMAESYILDGDSFPKPQPGATDSEMDVIEPIYLCLSASSQPVAEEVIASDEKK